MASQQPYYAASPPVVQGVVVPGGGGASSSRIYDHKHAHHGVGAMETSVAPHRSPLPPDADEGRWTKGEVQPRRCNDAVFAVLFCVHLGAMAWASAAFAPRMYGDVAGGGGYGGGGRERALGVGGDGGAYYHDGDGSSALGSLVGRMAEGASRLAGGTERGGSFVARLAEFGAGVLSHVSNDRDDDRRDLEEEENYGTNDVRDMMLLLGIATVIALAISTMALSVLIRHAQALIKFALLFNIAATAVVSLLFLVRAPHSHCP